MFLVCSGLGKSMLVSFLFFGKIFSFFSLYFWAYLKACYPFIIQVLSINKIESFNFSLVL